MTGPSLDTIVNLAKRRGIAFGSSEIYGGLRSTWDYGPLGVELKDNVKRAWWRAMVQLREDVVGLDAAILMHPRVWEASGHVESFTDPLVECMSCHHRFRADHLSDPPVCPDCGNRQFTDARNFNLMFKTYAGPVEDSGALVWLRPETAQGIFVDFTQVMASSRKKLPLGMGGARGHRQPGRLRPLPARQVLGSGPVLLRPGGRRALHPVRHRALRRGRPGAAGLPGRRLPGGRGDDRLGEGGAPHRAGPPPGPGPLHGGGAAPLAPRQPRPEGEGGRVGTAASLHDRLRRRRVDRPAVPPAGRDRHALRRDGGLRLAGRQRSDRARPGLDGPGAYPDRQSCGVSQRKAGGDMSSDAQIVNGSVLRRGAPMEGAYVRVLGPSGEFVNERRTGPEGRFKLHLTPATWTFIAFGPGTARIEREVTIEAGADQDVSFDLGGTASDG